MKLLIKVTNTATDEVRYYTNLALVATDPHGICIADVDELRRRHNSSKFRQQEQQGDGFPFRCGRCRISTIKLIEQSDIA